MLVKIKRNESIFVTNPWLSNIPEFTHVNEKQMRYVAFYADYKSPFRLHPDADHKKLSALEAGFVIQSTHDKTLEKNARTIINGESPEVNEAIAKYKTLAPDENRDQLKMYVTQMASIQRLVEKGSDDPAELVKLNNLLTAFPELKKSQLELAKLVGMEDELSKIQEETVKNKNRPMIDIVASEETANSDEV